MIKLIVTDPKGVLLGSDRIARGQELPSGASGSQVAAWKRFGQVKEVEVKEPKAPKPGSPPPSGPPDGEEGGGPPPDSLM